jgi:hypothetical protein
LTRDLLGLLGLGDDKYIIRDREEKPPSGRHGAGAFHPGLRPARCACQEPPLLIARRGAHGPPVAWGQAEQQGSTTYGRTGKLAAAWWQWALSKPVAKNPTIGSYSGGPKCNGQAQPLASYVSLQSSCYLLPRLPLHSVAMSRHT